MFRSSEVIRLRRSATAPQLGPQIVRKKSANSKDSQRHNRRSEQVTTNSHQVNRPTFERRDPPLSEVCRYISFEGLRESIEQVTGLIRYLKPEYLQEISESCTLD